MAENIKYAIETKSLVKRYKDKTVVKGLDLTIGKGEMFALLGANGAGKTTIIKMLTCLTSVSDGEAYIMGHSVITDSQRVKGLTNVSPQETAVAANLSVYENLVFMAGVYGFKKNDAKKRADEVLTDFGLDEVRNSKARILSGGWQRRLSIALAVISSPEVLFLDEPTLGLDVIARRELWREIKSLKGKITIVLTTHYLEEAVALSDRIGIMAKGELRDIGTADEIISRSGCSNFEDAFVKIVEGGNV